MQINYVILYTCFPIDLFWKASDFHDVAKTPARKQQTVVTVPELVNNYIFFSYLNIH
jgi:hypothetical protein